MSWRFVTYLCIAGLPFVFARTAGASVSPGIVNPVNGHTYHITDSRSWTSAEGVAESIGGHLATVNDAAEGQWIYDTFHDYNGLASNLWIGLYDADPLTNSTDITGRRAEFTWVSGQASDYSNWAPGEPSSPSEDYVFIANGTRPDAGLWNSYTDTSSSDRKHYGIIEVVPEPTLLPLAALVFLASMRRPRRRVGHDAHR